MLRAKVYFENSIVTLDNAMKSLEQSSTAGNSKFPTARIIYRGIVLCVEDFLKLLCEETNKSFETTYPLQLHEICIIIYNNAWKHSLQPNRVLIGERESLFSEITISDIEIYEIT